MLIYRVIKSTYSILCTVTHKSEWGLYYFATEFKKISRQFVVVAALNHNYVTMVPYTLLVSLVGYTFIHSNSSCSSHSDNAMSVVDPHDAAAVFAVFFYLAMHFNAKRGLAIACRLSVCLSVRLAICDHIGWKTWKLIARAISPTPSLFEAKRRSTYSQQNVGKFWGD